MNKSKIKKLIGIIVSIIFVVIIIYTVDLSHIWQNIKELSWQLYSILIIVYIISMSIRTLRWQLVINAKEDIGFLSIFKALMYGFMLNQLLPAKIGEVARAEYLTRRKNVSRSFLLGTIAVERIFDMIIILMFFAISVLFSDLIMDQLSNNLFPVILLIALFVLLVFLLFNLQLLKKLTTLLPTKIEKFLNNVFDNLTNSLKIFKSKSKAIKTLLFTLAMWLLSCLSTYLIIRELGITVPAYAYFFIVSSGTFGMIIPSTSANIGVYHGVAMGALMLFMVPAEKALSFAVIAHAFDFFPAIIFGGLVSIIKVKNNEAYTD